ncbi:MAG TPA: hemerythrin domain-containing protein [Gammaproteobacteria bacterium]|nr:hemerythrin domain-containing protein [Gammaproteobacteria bacterium]
MSTNGMISDYMTHHHRTCDRQLADAEAAVDGDDWDAASEQFTGFRAMIEQHFEMEEDVLFPEFEQRSGLTDGPTLVMRSEHEEMRKLLEQLQMALDSGDAETYLGTSETLMVMLQQHNMKEENMLYPMADGKLGEDAGAVLDRMRGL